MIREIAPSSPFRLYPKEAHWWSFADYAVVLRVVQRLAPRTVLEFGPGSSTLALIEGGAGFIDSLEDNSAWADIHRCRIERAFPTRVRICLYHFGRPLEIDGIDDKRYDLAMIDGPRETRSRPVAIAYALKRCSRVLVALEEFDCSPFLRPEVAALAAALNRPVEYLNDTGPLAGAFALIGPKC